MPSILLKSARLGGAVILPAFLVFFVASDDGDGLVGGVWVLYLTPVAWLAVIAVGWLDGRRAVVLTAVCSGVIAAVAGSVERDDRPLPLCRGVNDLLACKNDAAPEGGLGATAWVLIGGGAAALIAARRREARPSPT